ncbi:hypothetical protein C2E23DRAFT_882278 [Lenzites betulinus]|nr:hypothetical protein C2E23DRAFT_882278 [Lenzites betulinus]
MAAGLVSCRLSYDILVLVLEWLQDDYESLFSCSLVSHACREISATYLYKKVVYSPPSKPSPVLDLSPKQALDFMKGIFAPACTPHHVQLVQYLEVSGFLPGHPKIRNRMMEYIETAIKSWPNLQTIVLDPTSYHPSLFTEILPLLPQLQFLRSLHVNAYGIDQALAPKLTELRNLNSLTLHSPSRALLDLLPRWLGKLQDTLREFKLTHGCGSVTPGVLYSFLPYLQKIDSSALGLSYSLTNNDVFAFWEGLPHLQTLEYRYYLQLQPMISPRLLHLRHLTVHHWGLLITSEMTSFCKWIRHVIAKAPLESLRLVCEIEVTSPTLSFDPLIEHLSLKHATRLRILDMRRSYLGIKALRMLCRSCTVLEQLAVGISGDALDEFPLLAGSLVHLQTVWFRIRNCKGPVVISQSSAEILMRSAPCLRRVTVDGTRFEGLWKTGPDGDVRFVVERVQTAGKRFPAGRGSIEETDLISL